MITDDGGRHVVTALSDSTLWCYDRRWRRSHRVDPTGGRTFDYLEGRHHCAVVHSADGTTRVTVRSPAAPDQTIAKGTFHDGAWLFEGDAQAWGLVPEYLLVPGPSGLSLLRIADGAETDPMEELGAVTRVVEVPDSRLVVLSGGGSVTVYDPNTRIAGVRFKLGNGNDNPTMRFRNKGSELWIDDVDTMLKIETKTWTVADAAGSETVEENAAPAVGSWTFTPDESLAIVARPSLSDVLLVDTTTMAPVGRATFSSAPVDVAAIGRTILAVDVDGGALRAPLRT